MPGSLFSQSPFEDLAGLRFANSFGGEIIAGARRDYVSGIFTYGTPSQTFTPIQQWDVAGGAGVFNVNEHVVGGTSGAVGILLAIAAGAPNPFQLQTLFGAFTSGETITGIGITAAESGATRVITANPTGYGQITTVDSVLTITSGDDAPTEISLVSNQTAVFAFGHELNAFWTCAFPDGGALNTSQLVGIFSSGNRDGFAVGYNVTSATAFGLVTRRNNVTTFVAQTAWNIDPLDGTGPSGMTLDPAALNIFGLKFGYPGATLYVFDEEQRWWPVHRVTTFINAGITVQVFDPHMSMRVDLVNTGSLSVKTTRAGSWNLSSVGPAAGQAAFSPQRYNAFVRAPVTLVAAAERYLCSILNNLTFAGVRNNVPVRLTHVSIASDATTANHQLNRIRKNTPLTGSAFAAIDALNSCVSSDIAATGGFTSGRIVYAFPASGQNGAIIDLTDRNIIINPGETLTFTGEPTSNQITRITLRWEEAL